MKHWLPVASPIAVAVLVTVFGVSGFAAGQGQGNDRPVSSAGSLPRTADGKPDLRGRWNGPPTLTHTQLIEAHAGGFGVQAGKSLIIDPIDGIIPYQPWAITERDRRRRPESAYEDPVGHCEFHGVVRLLSWGFDIVYSGKRIIMFGNQHVTRSISMERQEHIPDGIRLWMGDAIGRWDGDTLVIDTTNFNGKTWLDQSGDFHSADLHIVERLTLTDARTLDWQLTLTDPKVFTRPWTMTSPEPYRRGNPPPNDAIEEDEVCHEGNVGLRHLQNIYDGAPETPPAAR